MAHSLQQTPAQIKIYSGLLEVEVVDHGVLSLESYIKLMKKNLTISVTREPLAQMISPAHSQEQSATRKWSPLSSNSWITRLSISLDFGLAIHLGVQTTMEITSCSSISCSSEKRQTQIQHLKSLKILQLHQFYFLLLMSQGQITHLSWTGTVTPLTQLEEAVSLSRGLSKKRTSIHQRLVNN